MATVSANPMTYEDGVTRPATADEIAALAESKTKENAAKSAQTAKENAAASAVSKLEAIGLTAEEIAALRG